LVEKLLRCNKIIQLISDSGEGFRSVLAFYQFQTIIYHCWILAVMR